MLPPIGACLLIRVPSLAECHNIQQRDSHSLPLGSPSTVDGGEGAAAPTEEGLVTKKKKKKAPVVQVKNKKDYVQPAMLRTMEARLNCTVTAAADPYSSAVRRISDNTNMSAKRIEQLYQLFLDASRGRKSLDPPSFRKVMTSVGQEDRGLNDRIYEILDVTRGMRVDFEQFCTCILTFKTGSRGDQARMIFKVIDVSDDKTLSKFEFLRFFCAGIKDKEKKRAMSDVVNELVRCLDQDGSGEVEHDEFVNSVSNDQEVWILFDAISPFTTMKEKLSKFEFEQIDHSMSYGDEP